MAMYFLNRGRLSEADAEKRVASLKYHFGWKYDHCYYLSAIIIFSTLKISK